MSWTHFSALIDKGGMDIADWQSAVRANPNDPAGALKVALLKIYNKRDMAALERFCECVIGLVKSNRCPECDSEVAVCMMGHYCGKVVKTGSDFPEL